MDLTNFKGVLLGFKEYSGDLGSFWYDPNEFSINTLVDGQDVIRYVGNFNKTPEIPYGIKKLCRTFHSTRGFNDIIIPETVTELGEYCFFGCGQLRNINIPETVSELGNLSFS